MERNKLLGKRKRRINTCPNPLFVKWLTEWCDEAEDNGWNTRFTYSKALSSLKKYPLPIPTGKDCKFLQFFGDKTCKMLDRKLAQHLAEFGTTAPMVLDNDPVYMPSTSGTYNTLGHSRSSSSAPSDLDLSSFTIPGPPSDDELNAGPQKPKQMRKTPNRSPREYIPAKGSGPYALLVTLYKNQQTLGSRGYMTKKELSREAQLLADKSLTIPDPGSRYTAWSSMGTLIKKGYIIKESSPAKFSITDSGCELASRLLAAEGTADKFDGHDNSFNGNHLPMDCLSPPKCSLPSHSTSLPKKTSAQRFDTVFSSDDIDHHDDIMKSTLTPTATSHTQYPQYNSVPSSRSADLKFWYVDTEGNLIAKKDQAEVIIDDDIGFGFLIKIKYQNLLMSGVKYELNHKRPMAQGYRYVYLSNEDAPDKSSPPENLSPGLQSFQSSSNNFNLLQKSQAKADLCMKPTTSSISTVKAKPSSSLGSKDQKDSDSWDYVHSAIKPITSSQGSDSLSVASCGTIHSVTSNKELPVWRPPSIDSQLESQSSSCSKTTSQREPPVPKYTLEPGKFDIMLCVDNQEHYGGGRKADLLPELIRNGVNFDVRKLQVGDFLWVAREKTEGVAGQLAMPTGRELVLDHIIERKRMDDLAGSIKDGRFKEQKFRLKSSGLRRPIYLVEDFGSNQHFSIKEDTLKQAISNTQVIDGFYVKETGDSKESVAYLTIMTRYLTSYYRNKRLKACALADILEYDEPYCINNAEQNLVTFEELSQSTVKNKPLTVKEQFGKQLMQFHGMSGDKAAAILQFYPTPNKLLRAYSEAQSDKERQSLLAHIKFGGMSRNIGIAISRNVCQLYCTKGALT